MIYGGRTMKKLKTNGNKIKIKKMPSKRILEQFLENGGVVVYFDVEKGIFKKVR